MSRAWFLPVLVAVVFIASVGSLIYVGLTGKEVATVVLSVPVLWIAAATLWLTMPKPARLVVIRPDELEFEDLIFSLNPAEEGGASDIPRDYLLQMHVAVCNVGDRKAVLSAIKIEGFVKDDKSVVTLPEAPAVISGHQCVQRTGWVNLERHMEGIVVDPPFVLDRDDVITMRFRARRGIDWTDRWDLDALRRFCEPLQSPIRRVHGKVIWRRGNKLVRDTFNLPLVVNRQEQFVQALKQLTDDFTHRPAIGPQQVEIE